MSHQKGTVIIKNFSRFSRRNSQSLMELEDLRDDRVCTVSIEKKVDFSNGG